MTQLILEHKTGIETLTESTLVVAIDDTGNENFKDLKHPVFGLGGCAFMVRDYQRLIEKPWNYMCSRFFPEVERPIHAADNLRNLTNEQLKAISHFFENFQFFRIATTSSVKSEKTVQEDFIQVVGASLLQRILDVAKWTDLDRLFILVEESERIEMKIVQSLSGKKIKTKDKEIKIEIGLVPKSACMAAMEVADVIIHTAGGQTRNRINGKKGFRPDFQKIFKDVDERLTSYMEITKIEYKN